MSYPTDRPLVYWTPMATGAELRKTIETFAAHFAAIRVAQGDLTDNLLNAFNEMRAAANENDFTSFALTDRKLHEVIVLMADTPGLLGAWQEVFKTQEAFRIETLKKCWPDLDTLSEAHRAIVDAICEGNPFLAERAMVTHMEGIWFRLAELSGNEANDRDPLSKACAYIAFNFQRTLVLAQVAAEVSDCSPGHLARLFRDKHGLSFTEYLNELRMQRAADLLQHTRITIRSIAAQVGYLDHSRFSSHFRRRFGQTPRKFRLMFQTQ